LEIVQHDYYYYIVRHNDPIMHNTPILIYP
jgi:hypothetical protein